MDLTTVILGVVGGLGMFLLGMTLMTEGLKAMAGDAIRGALMRFTRSPPCCQWRCSSLEP
jgi:phosphate:Na+ symporter